MCVHFHFYPSFLPHHHHQQLVQFPFHFHFTHSLIHTHSRDMFSFFSLIPKSIEFCAWKQKGKENFDVVHPLYSPPPSSYSFLYTMLWKSIIYIDSSAINFEGAFSCVCFLSSKCDLPKLRFSFSSSLYFTTSLIHTKISLSHTSLEEERESERKKVERENKKWECMRRVGCWEMGRGWVVYVFYARQGLRRWKA